MAQHESTADNTNNIFKCKHVDRLRVDIVERLKVEAGLGKAKAAEVDDERCDTCAFNGHVVRKREYNGQKCAYMGARRGLAR